MPIYIEVLPSFLGVNRFRGIFRVRNTPSEHLKIGDTLPEIDLSENGLQILKMHTLLLFVSFYSGTHKHSSVTAWPWFSLHITFPLHENDWKRKNFLKALKKIQETFVIRKSHTMATNISLHTSVVILW